MLERILATGDRTFRVPRWAWLPALLGLADLTVAGFGFYWDVSWHIEKGRDQFLFTPPHVLILIGLAGVGLLGLLALSLHRRTGTGGGMGVWGWDVPPGALLLIACGAFAVAGFPLDDIWHHFFGEDVTLWGPTHMLMISGAALSPLGFAMLLAHGARERGITLSGALRFLGIAVAGVMLIGLSAYQAEFDFGVPQFQLLYQPMLIAAAAALTLVTVRLVLGRGAALWTVAAYAVGRATIDLGLVVAGRGIARFPLYVGAALVVEAVALLLPRRAAAFTVLAGVGIGTLGVIADAGVLALWGKHAWSGRALLGGMAVGTLAALGASVVALGIASALRVEVPPVRTWLLPPAAAAIVLAALIPFPRVTGQPPGVTVRLTPAAAATGANEERVQWASATVEVRPSDAARRADWFEIMSWQGGGQVIAHLEPAGPGRYVTDRRVPLGGSWKTLLRLARGSQIVATPISLPPERTTGKPGIPAEPVIRRPMQLDAKLLLREAHEAPGWASPAGYGIVGAVGLLWIAAIAWTLGRLRGLPVGTPEPAAEASLEPPIAV